MKKQITIIDEGINGSGKALVNTNSKEFKELQKQIASSSNKQSKTKVIENILLSLRFKMESYLLGNESDYFEVGWFLKEYLKELNIKNKTFAEYIEYKESNLSALFAGRRKINYDLALKLGKIFKVEPTLWIHIQSKNELIKIEKETIKDYQNYNIKELIRKAG
jgi:addiction module HigA family antidote